MGIMGNIRVKLYEIWTGGSGGEEMSFKENVYRRRTKTDHNGSP